MSEEKEPTLVIKSEDLQDPKLYNFVKALIDSIDVDGDQFVGASEFEFYFRYGCPSKKELKIAIADIKLEPRLLIGEDVEVMCQEDSFNDDAPFLSERLTYNLISGISGSYDVGRGIDIDSIKPSLQWLKENFEVI